MSKTILTTVCQKDTPVSLTHDSEGTEFFPGNRVVFNRSGNIVRGTLLSFSSWWEPKRRGTGDTFWHYLQFKALIKGDCGKISTIKNINSLLNI